MRDMDIEKLLAALSHSPFRSRFALSASDRDYVARKTLATIRDHARKFILARLAAQAPPNDGKQTPMRGHPVFRAQHATATCCRKCLAKWHGIDRDRPLTDEEVDYVVRVIDKWVSKQISPGNGSTARQLPLFPGDA
jgi:hypothetical protein